MTAILKLTEFSQLPDKRLKQITLQEYYLEAKFPTGTLLKPISLHVYYYYYFNTRKTDIF